MKKTVILRTADGLIGTAMKVNKETFAVQRAYLRQNVSGYNKMPEPFQPPKTRMYRFEGCFHYSDTVPQKSFEIFDEVV